MKIEVRQLDINWDNDKNVVDILESPEALESFSEQGMVCVETITYPKAFFYTGFKIVEGALLHTPFFNTAEGNEALLSVKNPKNHDVWWIQSGKWNTNDRKYAIESYRTAGEMHLTIQNQTMCILNRTNNFTVGELESFLRDFKDDLWEIVLKNDSAVRANVEKNSSNVFNKEVLTYLDRFIEAAERLVKEPKSFLKEKQEEIIKSKVRPVSKTFRELATKPNSTHLTSRVHFESFDNPENRYVHYCIERLHYLFNKAKTTASRLNENYLKKADSYQSEAEKLEAQKLKIIDPDVFENERLEIVNRVKALDEKIELLVNKKYDCLSQIFSNKVNELKLFSRDIFSAFTFNENEEPIHTYLYSIDTPYPKNKNSFFCNTLDGLDFKTAEEYRIYDGASLLIKFPEKIYSLLLPYAKRNFSIRVTGNAVFVKQVVRFLKLLILWFSLTPRILLMGLTRPFQPVASSV